MLFSFEWVKGGGISINVAGEWLSPQKSKIYLKTKKCCFNCIHGDFMGSHFACSAGKTQRFVGIAACCEKHERL